MEGIISVFGYTLISKMATLYTKNVLPLIGGIISKNNRAYNYLPSSIDVFFNQDRLRDMLVVIGFQIRAIENYSFNISSAVIAEKI